MPFLVAFAVILITYLVKYKEDFEKEKLEKFALMSLAIVAILLLFTWIMS